jgi:hypothetical protein
MGYLTIKNFEKINGINGINGIENDNIYIIKIQTDMINIHIYRNSIDNRYVVHKIIKSPIRFEYIKITPTDINTLDKMNDFLDVVTKSWVNVC